MNPSPSTLQLLEKLEAANAEIIVTPPTMSKRRQSDTIGLSSQHTNLSTPQAERRSSLPQQLSDLPTETLVTRLETGDDDGNGVSPWPSFSQSEEAQGPEDALAMWVEMINDWPANPSKRLKQAQSHIGSGIPNPLRTMAWQLLAGTDTSPNKQKYVKLLEKKSPHEDQIKRDVTKMYEETPLLREVDSPDTLCRFLRAYSLYDLEMGYCPTLIHFAVLLLIEMPEEDAFAVLVALMEKYKLRRLFLPEKPLLELSLFQFRNLLHDHAPEVLAILDNQDVDISQFAGPWLLTCYSTCLPLPVTLHIIDYFLACSTDAGAVTCLLQIGVALLSDSREELEGRSSEEIMHYLQNELRPRHSADTRTITTDPRAPNEASSVVIVGAMHVKVASKRMKQLEKAYEQEKEAHLARNDRVAQLHEDIAVMSQRLEDLATENTDLRSELQAARALMKAELAKQATQCEQYDILIEQLRQENHHLFLQLSPADAKEVLDIIAQEGAAVPGSATEDTGPLERMSSDQRRQLFERQQLLESQLAQLPSHRIAKPDPPA